MVEEVHVNANWWLTKVVQNLEQFADAFPDEDKMYKEFSNLNAIWEELIDFRFETRKYDYTTRATEDFYASFPEWFVEVLQELSRRTSLSNINWIPADEDDDSSAKTLYGHFFETVASDNEEEF